MDQVQKFLAKVYRGVGTPRAYQALALVEAGEWAELQKLTLSTPGTYGSAREYHLDATVVELTRKLLLPGDNDARYRAAVDTFWASETQCASTNARLSRFIGNQGPFEDPSDEAVIRFIANWRKEVKRVLGRCSYVLEPRFSGGSTLSDAGKLTTIPDKMSSTPTAYAGLTDALLLNFKRTPFLEFDDGVNPMVPKVIEIVDSNHFFTVPKDSQKDRGCCVEASLNISLQLAVGAKLKACYRRAYGVDLRKAKPLHQRLACQASIDGSLATIDLSNASDTVASALVKLVLPADWYELLNSLRAKATLIDEKRVYLQKFSSMGNGFTFELETILFRSLMQTLGAKNCNVFGDDIIVETELAASATNALKFFGFTPNAKKTFCEGPFRESCGGDFFNGEPVRAHYLKKIPDEPQNWVALHNGLKRVDRYGLLSAAMWFCVDQVPVEWRNFGPSWLEDSVFHSDEALPKMHRIRRRETSYDPASAEPPRLVTVTNMVPCYKTMQPVSQKFPLGSYWSYRVATASASLGIPSEVSPRKSVLGYKPVWVPAVGIADDPGWWCQPDE